VPVKHLAQVIGVPLLVNVALLNPLVATTALRTKPGDLAGSPVALGIGAARHAATEMTSASSASVTRQVALGRSPRWWKMQVHDYQVYRRAAGSFVVHA